MKNFYTFLLAFSVSTMSLAQAVNLESTDPWILDKLVIGGVDYPAPSNSEISEVTTRFYFDYDIYVFEAIVCALLEAFPDFNGDDQFELFFLDDPQLGTCTLTENNNYETLFFGFYSEGIVYNYVIDTVGDYFILTIDHPNGDQAIYRRMVLGTEDFDGITFTMFPNPVSERLFVSSDQSTIQGVRVMDINGRSIQINNAIEDGIDVSRLSNGLYFLEVTNQGGKTVKRFIKE